MPEPPGRLRHYASDRDAKLRHPGGEAPHTRTMAVKVLCARMSALR